MIPSLSQRVFAVLCRMIRSYTHPLCIANIPPPQCLEALTKQRHLFSYLQATFIHIRYAINKIYAELSAMTKNNTPLHYYILSTIVYPFLFLQRHSINLFYEYYFSTRI